MNRCRQFEAIRGLCYVIVSSGIGNTITAYPEQPQLEKSNRGGAAT
jgi:hypothetical protein